MKGIGVDYLLIDLVVWMRIDFDFPLSHCHDRLLDLKLARLNQASALNYFVD
jgi:hypothetical protein